MKVIQTTTAVVITASIVMGGNNPEIPTSYAQGMHSLDPDIPMNTGGRVSPAYASIVNYSLPSSTPASFPDVKGHWAESSIKWAVNKGLAKGYADGTFKPNGNVTPAEFAVMILALSPPEVALLSPLTSLLGLR